MDRDGFPTLRRLGVDHFVLSAATRFQVDADVLVVDDAAFACDAKAFTDRIERGDALLTVQNVLHRVPGWRLRKLEVAEFPKMTEPITRLPEDEGAYRETLQDAVDQLRGL